MKYTIKEVSEKTGISPYTLRFYEKKGILPNIERDVHGVRMFDDDHIIWIEMVQALRSTNLPLLEIKQYLELYNEGNKTLQQRKVMLTHQKFEVEKQISCLMKALERINYKLALIDVQENKYEKMP
ncbi:HTH-type transcriptional regulator AdhR [Clostridium puniceum]|uniref:HTH-type transcriptional regulator AdhR n=1 Tax=Clostridium puniceum TaxID=29367 RepID=A0A1S8TVS6_9CLOT|nr:MerR family transcriptional regulator [Clostridium puniceum]OOM81818.1 HTH-type transcriptional regulator AdhR [Clostridium puniceum]